MFASKFRNNMNVDIIIFRSNHTLDSEHDLPADNTE